MKGRKKRWRIEIVKTGRKRATMRHEELEGMKGGKRETTGKGREPKGRKIKY